jgi:hypothetical protein
MAQIGVDEKGKFGEHTQVDWEGGRLWKNEVQGCAALSSRRQRSTQSPGNDITILTHVFSGEWKYCG